jgi:hypothetical protein
MKIIKQIEYSEVLDFFNKEHPTDENNPHFAGNKWGKMHLDWANTDASGVWSLCELDKEDILGVVVPFHEAEESENILVDLGGQRVGDVILKLKDTWTKYAEENPVCWAKIMYWKGKPFSPLFLATKPVRQGRRGKVDEKLGTLFHLDGLHRILRWGLDNRFESDEKLKAYIAGVIK